MLAQWNEKSRSQQLLVTFYLTMVGTIFHPQLMAQNGNGAPNRK